MGKLYYLCSRQVIPLLDTTKYLPVHTFGANPLAAGYEYNVGSMGVIYSLDYVLIKDPDKEMLIVLALSSELCVIIDYGRLSLQASEAIGKWDE